MNYDLNKCHLILAQEWDKPEAQALVMSWRLAHNCKDIPAGAPGGPLPSEEDIKALQLTGLKKGLINPFSLTDPKLIKEFLDMLSKEVSESKDE